MARSDQWSSNGAGNSPEPMDSDRAAFEAERQSVEKAVGALFGDHPVSRIVRGLMIMAMAYRLKPSADRILGRVVDRDKHRCTYPPNQIAAALERTGASARYPLKARFQMRSSRVVTGSPAKRDASSDDATEQSSRGGPASRDNHQHRTTVLKRSLRRCAEHPYSPWHRRCPASACAHPAARS